MEKPLRKTSEFRYLIFRQGCGERLGADSLADIANYLSSDPFHVSLHLDHAVQLNGWEIKTNKTFNPHPHAN